MSAVAGNGQATVTWSSPGSTGGAAITNYVVTPYVGGSPRPASTVGAVTSTIVTGLTNRTPYTFRVAARNAVGAGPDSGDSNAVTPAAPRVPVVLRCVVPNVVGKTLAAAKRLLAGARCRVGTVRQAYSARVRKGRVIAQSRARGRSLPLNSRVALTLSRGKPPRR